MRRIWFGAVGIAAVGSLIAGCVLFTGGSGGYTLVDAGEDAVAACPDGAPFCLEFACSSTADCNGGAEVAPEAGGQVCCFGVSLGGAVGTSCQSNCQTRGEVAQVCSTNAECGGAECIFQQCELSGFPLDFHGCGVTFGCSPVESTSDAGALDAATSDAATVDAGANDAGPADAGIADGG
jgi:hypothetical protein